MCDFKKKYFRKLRYKSKYVNLEHEEVLEIYESAKKEFIAAISEYAYKNKKGNPLKSSEATKEKTTSSLTGSEVKKVYRDIALKTHPDKLSNCDKDEMEEKKEIYNKAIKARNENDIDTLIRLASDLNIEMEPMSMDSLENLEKQIEKKEKSIESMHKDVAWIWYYENKQGRKNILDNIFKSV